MTLNKLRKVSIKWRLFLYLLLFSAVTLLLLWFFQVVFLDSFYKSIKTRSIKSTANSIADSVNSSDLDDTVKQIALKNEACIILTDIEGNALYSADYIPNNKINEMYATDYSSLVTNALSNGGSYLTLLNNNENPPPMGQQPENPQETPEKPAEDSGAKPDMPKKKGEVESIVYTKIAKQSDGTQIAIIFNAEITPVDATVSTLRTQLIYVTAIMLALTVLLALISASRIAKPIIKMNKSAKELAKGNYAIQFNVGSYREITELGETLNYATAELQKTDQLRRDLIANISHDLRTPLTMITGYAEMMRDLPGENTEENIQIIIDEAKRLTSLVNDVLDISKLESGTQKLNPTEFNLTESIKDILKRYQKLTEQDGYSIKFLYDSEVSVYADELRISQVVYNLVNNAINYTGKDKAVIVRQSSGDGKVKIEVIDTGNGIPEDQLPLIWDRYFKVKKGKKRVTVGTGLGLSIVKAILEQHDAAYGVQSTIGQGSIFWFEMKTI